MLASDPLAAAQTDGPRHASTLDYAAVLQTAAKANNLRKSEGTRLRLLAAVAMRLAKGDKVADLRVTDIADAAGVAHGTFYRYFSDREEIVEVVVSGFVSFVQDGLKEARSGQAGTLIRAHAATLAYVRLFRCNAGLMRLLLAVDASSPARDRFHALNRDWNRRVAATIALRRLGASSVKEEMIEAVLPEAYALGGMVDEFLAQLYLRQDPVLVGLVDDEKAVAHLLTMIWYRAAFGEPPIVP